MTLEDFFTKENQKLTKQKDFLESDILFLDSEMKEQGISEDRIEELIKANCLHLITKGIYGKSGEFIDEFLIRQNILSKGIYSFETALYLHDLTDKFPYKVFMSFPAGYRLPQGAGQWGENVVIKNMKENTSDIGIVELSISNSKKTIKVYSKERTLCDIVSRKNTVEQEVINHAYRTYLQADDSSVNRLLRMAKKVNTEKQVRQIVEVLL